MKKDRKKFKDTMAGKLLKGFMPDVLDTIGSIIPGASVVTNLIKKVTGSGNIPDEDKETILAELNNELRLAEIEAADRDSARNREVALQAAGGSNWFMYVVGMFVMLSTMAIVYVALFEDVKDENLFYFIAGNVFSYVTVVIAYFFGSSKGSADKNKILR